MTAPIEPKSEQKQDCEYYQNRTWQDFQNAIFQIANLFCTGGRIPLMLSWWPARIAANADALVYGCDDWPFYTARGSFMGQATRSASEQLSHQPGIFLGIGMIMD